MWISGEPKALWACKALRNYVGITEGQTRYLGASFLGVIVGMWRQGVPPRGRLSVFRLDKVTERRTGIGQRSGVYRMT